jgi:hypothetical protein
MLQEKAAQIKQEPRKFCNEVRSLNCNMIQPAVRTVVISAWANANGESGYELLPVLAITAEAFRHFSKYVSASNWPNTSGTEKNLLKRGFDLDGQHVRYSAIVIMEGRMTDLDDLEEYYDSVQQIAACPWPPEQDEEKLASQISQSLEKAKRQLAWPQKREAEA